MTRPKPLAGLRVAIVGKFSVWQVVVAEMIEEAGGTYVDFVDRSTSFLVSGEGSREGNIKSFAHRAKMSAAKENGVKIISESQLEELIRPYAEYDPEVHAQQVMEKLESQPNYGEW